MARQIFITICAAAAALCCTACGPSTSGVSLEEAGLRRTILSTTPTLSISGLETKTPDAPIAAVIFIHGTPGSAEGWVDMLKATPSNVYAVAIDRPGYGETRPKDAVTALSAHAQAVIDVSRAIKAAPKLGKAPIVLVGHSYGGPIAAKASADQAELFSAAVIAAGALDPALEETHWAQRLGTWQPFKFLIGHTLRTANVELMTLEAELDALSAELGRITVPTYIIHGTEDDLVPYANVAFMEEKFAPGVVCETLTLEGQNHFLPWNEIDAFWTLIVRAATNDGVQC